MRSFSHFLEASTFIPFDQPITRSIKRHLKKNDSNYSGQTLGMDIEFGSYPNTRGARMTKDAERLQKIAEEHHFITNIRIEGKELEFNTPGFPYLSRKDFLPLLKLFNALAEAGFPTTSETSAHIHVGFPPDFSLISKLNLHVMMDEDAVIHASERTEPALRRYAYRSSHYKKQILSVFEKGLEDHILRFPGFVLNLWDNKKSHTMNVTLKELGIMLGSLSHSMSDFYHEPTHYQGINLESEEKVEFRYPTSQLLKDGKRILTLIDYFMNLVLFAHKEKSVTFKNENIEVIIFPNDNTNWMFKVTINQLK